MTTSNANITVIDPASPEGNAWVEKLKLELEEQKAWVRQQGGTFYIGQDGKPQSLGEDD